MKGIWDDEGNQMESAPHPKQKLWICLLYTSTANSYDLCTTAARKEWGFAGIIMTDWTTTNADGGSSAAKCIAAGDVYKRQAVFRMHGDRGPHNIPTLDDRDFGGGYLYTGQSNELWLSLIHILSEAVFHAEWGLPLLFSAVRLTVQPVHSF